MSEPIQWNLPRDFTPSIPGDLLMQRRRELQRRLGEKGVLILFAASDKVQSGGGYVPFRQDSDFYYLTGLSLTPSRLVITSEDFWLFADEPDPEKEVWEGVRPNHGEIMELCPATAVFSLAEFSAKSEEALRGRSRLYFPFGQNPEADHEIFAKLDGMLRRSRAGQFAPTAVFHTHLLTHEMRLIKSPWEIDRMRETAAITDEAHRAIQRLVRPGIREYELEAELLRSFHRHGASPAYPSIVASGSNACVLHYVENHREIQAGELILVDAAAMKNGIHSDVTRTFPSNGRFSQEQRAVYEAVLAAQTSAIAKTTADSSMDEAHRAAIEVIVAFLRGEKILKESEEECLEQELYRPFYMHRTGHWIGYDVHDVGAYYGGQEWIEEEAGPRKLRPGMVCTVEPGLYFSPGLESGGRFRGIGIRIEDDVLITADKPDVLTGSIPKTIDEIETFMGGQG